MPFDLPSTCKSCGRDFTFSVGGSYHRDKIESGGRMYMTIHVPCPHCQNINLMELEGPIEGQDKKT